MNAYATHIREFRKTSCFRWFPSCKEVHIITGDWDFLIKVKERDVIAVGNFVVDKLRTVQGISKTLTCMVFDAVKETMDVPLEP